MKTNTDTELREQLIKGFENVDFESTAIANFVDARIDELRKTTNQLNLLPASEELYFILKEIDDRIAALKETSNED